MKAPKNGRRPSLEELQSEPTLIQLELAHIMVEAEKSGNVQLAELAEEAFMLEDATAERVVELRNGLQPVAKSAAA